jgi:hypothetical protein
MPNHSPLSRIIALLATVFFCQGANANNSVPSTPTDFSVHYYSDTAAEVMWTASTDPDGIDFYKVYFSGVLFRELAGPSFFVDTLLPDTTYNMQFSSIDRLGQESVWSPVIRVHTGERSLPAFSEQGTSNPSDDAAPQITVTVTEFPITDSPATNEPVTETDIPPSTTASTGISPPPSLEYTPPLVINDAPVSNPVLSDGPSLKEVPGLLDNLYKYNVNSSSDLVTYQRPDGTMMQLFTYWANDRRLHVTERAFPDGEFSTPVDIHAAVLGNNEALAYDSHNVSAIGVASNGVMFVTGNHHVNQLNMAKSTTRYDINSFSNMLPEDMVRASDVDRVTYPSFFSHNNNLYFSYREQEVGQGAPRFRWLINKYDPARDEWSHAVQFNTGISLRMYVSNIFANDQDNTLHLFFTWRDDAATTGSGVENHRDYVHLYSKDASNWHIYNSTKTINSNNPLWFDNGRVSSGYTGTQAAKSEKIWSWPSDPKPRGAGAVTVDDSGHPHSLVKADNGALYHNEWDGTRWRSNELRGWNAHGYDIVNCPGETAALLSLNDKVYYRSLDSAKKSYNNPVLLADGFTSSHYTLSVDNEAIKSGYVSFLLTSNSHFSPGQHDPNNALNPQPAWIATFHCDELAGASAFRR